MPLITKLETDLKAIRSTDTFVVLFYNKKKDELELNTTNLDSTENEKLLELARSFCYRD